MVWYSHLFQNFPQFIVIHTVKGFGIVNKGEIDVFLELSCFFNDPEDAGNLISGSSAFSKTSLNIWKFAVLSIYLMSLVTQMVKCLPAMQEIWVQSLGPEDPLEKDMATHSSILARRIPRAEEPGGYSPWGRKELDTTEWHTHTHTYRHWVAPKLHEGGPNSVTAVLIRRGT